MKDIKSIVSANLATLRKQKGITQAELAEKLNYSDKAISRWEKGDTLPDLNVLYEICEFYGVTMNDLISEEPLVAPQDNDKPKNIQKMYRLWLCILATASVFLFATLWFIFNLVTADGRVLWNAFVWAVPFSCIFVMFIGKGLFNWIAYFVFGSVSVWSMLTAAVVHIQFFSDLSSNAVWFFFVLGIPLQAMLFFSQMVLKSRERVKINREELQNEGRTNKSTDIEGQGK